MSSLNRRCERGHNNPRWGDCGDGANQVIMQAAIARVRGWLFDVTAHHHAENLRTVRAAARKAQGLDLEDYPYPGSVNISGNTLTPPADPPAAPPAVPPTVQAPAAGMSMLKKLLIGTALAGAGGAGVLGVNWLFSRTPPAATTPAPIGTAPAGKKYGVIHWKIVNGVYQEDKTPTPLELP